VDRRLVRHCLLTCFISLALSATRLAWGAPNDAAAQKLRDQAIDQDYLATNYAAAEKKLTQALGLCAKTSNCSPFVRARVHCDLGVVEFMQHKLDLARTEFATALMEDPNVGLDPNLSNTDVQREFAAVKSGGPPPAAPPAAAPEAPPAAAPEAAAGASGQGGMAHAAPARQQVHTPLPLYVEVPADLGATKVTVRYKPAGGIEWKTAPMLKMGDGYGVEIPCVDIGGREGELQYFIQAHDASGDLVASSGRSATPHIVAIVKKLTGEPLHFPSQPPPQACKPGSEQAETPSTTTTEAGDCPPGFPGCHTEGPASCESKADCMAAEECVEQVCKRVSEDERRPYKKNWLSIGVQAELMFMPGADDACAGGKGYTCFLSDSGAYYADIPVLGRDDKVLGGLANAPMLRILVGYDRVILPNVTVGGRLGYAVFGGGPQRPANGATGAGPSFMPLHIEARAAYWFGKNVFARKGLRFFALLAGGMTEADASEPIDVFSSSTKQVFVDAWTKTGLGFAALGPGMMYAITPNSGLVVELKVIELFPTAGTAIGAQLGYAIGL
jgi:hypothetical protein